MRIASPARIGKLALTTAMLLAPAVDTALGSPVSPTPVTPQALSRCLESAGDRFGVVTGEDEPTACLARPQGWTAPLLVEVAANEGRARFALAQLSCRERGILPERNDMTCFPMARKPENAAAHRSAAECLSRIQNAGGGIATGVFEPTQCDLLVDTVLRVDSTAVRVTLRRETGNSEREARRKVSLHACRYGMLVADIPRNVVCRSVAPAENEDK